MKEYQVLLHQESYQEAQQYLAALVSGEASAGLYLSKRLGNRSFGDLSVTDFINLLLQTKQPQIFAESAVAGDGSDWTLTELSLLGDIGVIVPVQVFDNGRHRSPKIHASPFEGFLLFTAGALLRSGSSTLPADWEAVVVDDKIVPSQFNELYEKRLIPLLDYINRIGRQRQQEILLTIPGLGCGQFAGKFKGRLGSYLQDALVYILEKHGHRYSHIKAIYYDPYEECSNATFEINNTLLLVRPLTKGNEGKSQLSHPSTFGEGEYDFSSCLLCSCVAWDHVSWPGNDSYIGHRMTDDGVKAAATSSMYRITGIEGYYSTEDSAYLPPTTFKNWDAVVRKHQLQFDLLDSLIIYPPLDMDM